VVAACRPPLLCNAEKPTDACVLRATERGGAMSNLQGFVHMGEGTRHAPHGIGASTRLQDLAGVGQA